MSVGKPDFSPFRKKGLQLFCFVKTHYYLCVPKRTTGRKSDGVKVAQQILVLLVLVRIQVGLHNWASWNDNHLSSFFLRPAWITAWGYKLS